MLRNVTCDWEISQKLSNNSALFHTVSSLMIGIQIIFAVSSYRHFLRTQIWWLARSSRYYLAEILALLTVGHVAAFWNPSLTSFSLLSTFSVYLFTKTMSVSQLTAGNVRKKSGNSPPTARPPCAKNQLLF